MRRCNDVVFATSSDVSITTTWQRQGDIGQRRRNNVLTKSLCLLGHHGQQVSPIQQSMFSTQQYRQSSVSLQPPLANPVPHQYIQSRYDNVSSNENHNIESYSY